MSSVNAEDTQLMNASSQMSCQVMTELAKDEARRNMNPLSYQVVHPACSKFQELADRETEYFLQKAQPDGKKACFEKATNFQEGPWTSQFAPLMNPNIAFDVWSRRKGAPYM